MTSFLREEWEDNLLQVRCLPRPWSDDVAVYFVKREFGSRSIAKITEFEKVPEGASLPPEPSIALPTGLAQILMDELWTAGIRPSEARGGNDVVAAHVRHLEDMRALAFAKLGVDLPKASR